MNRTPAEMTAELTMKELLEQYPGARRALFSAFHIGGCQSCAYQLEDTLATVCEAHQIDPAEALRCLRESQQHDREMLITPSELKELIEGPETFTFFDTRTREEFEAVSLPPAEFMTQERQTALFADKDQTQKVILIDHRGQNILDQCAWFRGHGLKSTFGVEGGIDQYAREIDSSLQRYALELD